jgi:hypothetical protein
VPVAIASVRGLFSSPVASHPCTDLHLGTHSEAPRAAWSAHRIGVALCPDNLWVGVGHECEVRVDERHGGRPDRLLLGAGLEDAGPVDEGLAEGEGARRGRGNGPRRGTARPGRPEARRRTCRSVSAAGPGSTSIPHMVSLAIGCLHTGDPALQGSRAARVPGRSPDRVPAERGRGAGRTGPGCSPKGTRRALTGASTALWPTSRRCPCQQVCGRRPRRDEAVRDSTLRPRRQDHFWLLNG